MKTLSNKHRLVTFSLSSILALGAFCQPALAQKNPPPSLKEKLGQMFILGFASDTPASFEQEGMKELIEQNNIGGVILFDQSSVDKKPRNIRTAAQVKLLNSYLEQLKTKLPPLISIDQEGGSVERLKVKYGFVEVKAAQELARISDKAVACGARIVSTQLEQLGFNLNFAPVADATTEASLGSQRTFSDSPKQIEKLNNLVINELHQRNVGATLKHFPGMSLAEVFGDTHMEVVALKPEWKEEGHKAAFSPFKNLKDETAMIMVSHLMNPVDQKPASLSADVMGFLRKEIGYKGLVVTDDLDMKGVPEDLPLTDVVKTSINAGADLILIGNNLKYRPEEIRQMIQNVQEAAERGEISRRRIEESYARIKGFKANLKNKRLQSNTQSFCSDEDLKSLWSSIIRFPDPQDTQLLFFQGLDPEDWNDPTRLGIL